VRNVLKERERTLNTEMCAADPRLRGTPLPLPPPLKQYDAMAASFCGSKLILGCKSVEYKHDLGGGGSPLVLMTKAMHEKMTAGYMSKAPGAHD